MAAPKSSDADIQKWRDIISAGELSGASAKDYCAQHNINTKTYSSWKKRLKGLGMNIPAPAATATRPVAVAKPKSLADPKPSPKVSSIVPNFGKKPDSKVDVANLVIFATLPNGVSLEVKCATDVEFDKALQKLSQLKL